ncbi:MAG: glycoside hydrolase family 3 N-terminal domain-containing protein, partial [Eubacteriales bacterium]
EGDFLLSSEEKELLSLIKKYFDKIAVVVNSGNIIDLSFTECEEIKALVLLNLPGMEGGNALGNILSGKATPSGRLTDTIARSYYDYPASRYFGKKAGIVQNYYEDIFVGYRYFETFENAKKSVLYPFGYGLSYTEFKKEILSFEADERKIKVLVKVSNIGKKYSGKETAMLFSSSPENALGAPKYELRAFEKTSLLAPGESETLTLSFDIADMASFDDTGVLGYSDSWVMAAGKYRIYLGENAENLSPAGEYFSENTKVIKKCTHIPTELEKRLKADGTYEALECIPPDPSRGIQVDPFEKNIFTPENFFCRGEDSVTYRFDFSVPGLYKVRFHAEDAMPEKIIIAESEFYEKEKLYSENGEDIIFPFGTVDIVLYAKDGSSLPLAGIELTKNDAPIKISAAGTSLVECGKYAECALWVINKSFSDNDEGAKISRGRGLFRMHSAGRYALYKLDFEKAGVYDVRLRYSTTHDTRKLDDTFSFLVSNVTQDIEEIYLEHTTDDDTTHVFKTSAPFSLAFPAGEAYLKIVSRTDKTPFTAYLEISPCERKIGNIEKRTAEIIKNSSVRENNLTPSPLPEKEGEIDLRKVARGEMSMSEFVSHLSGEQLAAITCGNANGQIGYIPELGIPEVLWSDGPVGYRQKFAVTVYPSSTMISSAWNKALAYEFGKAVGTEGRLYNIGAWLAPAMNIHRDPCCGRNFEYHSEDPYLTGSIVSNIVNGTEEASVATVIKHFTANNTEYERLKSNSRVSARALREIYMRAFEMVIRDASPSSVMTSYNLINGIKVSENPLFCTDIMRKDFGYSGMLMSDFANGASHVKELCAGHDLKMPFGDIKSVAEAIENGTLSRTSVEECASRVLEFIIKTALS